VVGIFSSLEKAREFAAEKNSAYSGIHEYVLDEVLGEPGEEVYHSVV
jgi:hypothetical protein